MKKIKVLCVLLLVLGLCACTKKEEPISETKEEETSSVEDKMNNVIHAEITVKDYGTMKLIFYFSFSFILEYVFLPSFVPSVDILQLHPYNLSFEKKNAVNQK